jgi:hypothetical protein
MRVLSQIPASMQQRVYKAIVSSSLVADQFISNDGTCGCPLVVAACAAAHEPISRFQVLHDQVPMIAHRLEISKESVYTFIHAWDKSGYSGRRVFKYLIWMKLARLSVVDAFVSLKPRFI